MSKVVVHIQVAWGAENDAGFDFRLAPDSMQTDVVTLFYDMVPVTGWERFVVVLAYTVVMAVVDCKRDPGAAGLLTPPTQCLVVKISSTRMLRKLIEQWEKTNDFWFKGRTLFLTIPRDGETQQLALRMHSDLVRRVELSDRNAVARPILRIEVFKHQRNRNPNPQWGDKNGWVELGAGTMKPLTGHEHRSSSDSNGSV